jgi:glycogen debranching enzyme
LRFRGRSLGLALHAPAKPELSFAIPMGDGSWLYNSLGAGLRLRLRALEGRLVVDAAWQARGSVPIRFEALPGETGCFDLLVEEYPACARLGAHTPSFEEEQAAVEADFQAFSAGLPGGRAPSASLASYVLWSSMVEAEGNLLRPSVLMSKNLMAGVWSWDHCFNALALGEGHADLAFDQLMVILDHQDKDGCLPDAVFDSRVIWNFVKPPIHGWAVARLVREGALGRDKEEELYDRLSGWTDYWFLWKDFDHDGLPQYDHGNDSGWDNASVFSVRPPIEAPDLAAFLVLQMDALAILADRLGRAVEASAWRDRSERFLRLAIGHLRRGDRMAHIASGSHVAAPGMSLLPYLQLLLGERLPGGMRMDLIRSLREDGFLTPWGLATESTRSPWYRSDGYWLGPIWAPSSLLMVEALSACGERGLAADVAGRFLALADHSGFSENYDALTGEALCDRPFSWTASVYLLLAGGMS